MLFQRASLHVEKLRWSVFPAMEFLTELSGGRFGLLPRQCLEGLGDGVKTHIHGAAIALQRAETLTPYCKKWGCFFRATTP